MTATKIYPDLTRGGAILLNKLVKFSLEPKEVHEDCGSILIYNLFRGNYKFSYDTYQEILTYLSKKNLIFKTK